MLKRRKREADEALDRMTLAVNQGYVNARSEKAARAWNARREARAGVTQSVEEYHATVARLAARFPDNVMVH